MMLPGRTVWHQAVRMLVAAGIAYFATRAFGLRSGYWAMITTVLVVQGDLGGTLSAGFYRLVSTVIGGVAGMLGVLARTHHLAPDWVALGLVLAPLTLLAANDTRLRPSPVTALIVMLVTPTSGSGIELALGRIGEIGIGSLIGIAVSALLLPRRAEAALREHVAAALRGLGELAEAYLAGTTPPDSMRNRMRAAIAAAEVARDALRQEQTVHLARGHAADPLLAGLRALRIDVFMLRRVAVAFPDTDRGKRFAGPARRRFDALAAAIGNSAPIVAGLAEDASGVPEPLRFCLDVLQGDLAAMERSVVETGIAPVETAAD